MSRPRSTTLRSATGALTGAGLLALTTTIAHEGMKLRPYRDPIGVITWCAGETQGKPKPVYTYDECVQITINALERYLPEKCTKRPMSMYTTVAFLTFSYNLGLGVYCKRIAPLWDAGREREACDKMLAYNRAGGIVFRGLVKRRNDERNMCIKGLG